MSLRPVLACAAAALLAAGAAAAGPGQQARRSGKVVRVERTRSAARRYPRALQAMSATQVTAYGWEPQVGAEIVLLDPQGVVARAVVTHVVEKPAVCQSALFDVDIEVEHWDRQFNYGMIGVAGTDLDDGARTIAKAYTAPSGRQGEYVWTGIDRDGNAVEDMLVTSYSCADSEPAGTGAGASTPHCIDAYVRTAASEGWERVTHDVFYQCQ